ncbi:MAG: hypothetical protein V4487_07145, partial [Chlamydiota bacterium]
MAWSGFFAFVGGAAFLIIGKYNKTPEEFGLLFAFIMMGMVLGTLLSGYFFRSWPLKKTVLLGISILTSGGFFLLFPFDSDRLPRRGDLRH